MKVKWQVEIDDFCNKVLEKHWPNVKRYKDIYEVGGHNLEGVDLICGGDPCQPHSTAGQQKGTKDDRYLWPEMFRVIQEVRPCWVVNENVIGSVGNGVVDLKCNDLESIGYATQPFTIPACAVSADHRRDRVWIIAHANKVRESQSERDVEKERGRYHNGIKEAVADTDKIRRNSGAPGRERIQRGNQARHEIMPSVEVIPMERWAAQPFLVRGLHGIPRRVERVEALGNAVVPQVVEVIGRAIMEIERDN